MTNLANMPPRGLKAPRPSGKALRKAAKGMPCTLRVPGVCNHNPETTVLCHLRMFGWAGAAQKPRDYLAVFACSSCHDALDRRSRNVAIDPWDLLRAMGETLMAQEAAGNLEVRS